LLDSLTPCRILTPRDDFSSDDDSEDVVIPCEIRDSAFEARHDPRQADHGRLFVAQGRSRYINSEKANQVRANHVFSILRSAIMENVALVRKD
jgi:hypothetical protein